MRLRLNSNNFGPKPADSQALITQGASANLFIAENANSDMGKLATMVSDKSSFVESKVLIFHGFDSSCENPRYQNLPFETVGVNVDHRKLSWQEVYNIYNDLITEASKGAGKIILLGHSLGGWWARYFARKNGLRAVLLNPVVEFHTTKTAIPEREEYEKHKADLKNWHGGRITYYIELPDEVIDYSSVLDDLRKDGQVITRDGGHHRIRWPETIPQLLIDMSNTVCSCSEKTLC